MQLVTHTQAYAPIQLPPRVDGAGLDGIVNELWKRWNVDLGDGWLKEDLWRCETLMANLDRDLLSRANVMNGMLAHHLMGAHVQLDCFGADVLDGVSVLVLDVSEPQYF
jgi:hypothetical protein